MTLVEPVVEYVNRVKRMIHDLSVIGQTISKFKKMRSILWKLHSEFDVISKVIGMTENSFSEALSQLTTKRVHWKRINKPKWP